MKSGLDSEFCMKPQYVYAVRKERVLKLLSGENKILQWNIKIGLLILSNYMKKYTISGLSKPINDKTDVRPIQLHVFSPISDRECEREL